MSQDIKEKVHTLVENFSELESDLPPEMYKALAPHINGITEGLTGALANAERLARIGEFVSILLSNPRMDVRQGSLDELKAYLESTNERFNGWSFGLNILEQEEPQEQAITEAPETAQPLATARLNVSAGRYNDLRRRIPRHILDRYVRVVDGTVDVRSVNDTITWIHTRDRADRTAAPLIDETRRITEAGLRRFVIQTNPTARIVMDDEF